MVDRITPVDYEPGDLLEADKVDEIINAVNALGTAADANTGTTAGCVPVIGADNKLSSAILPDAITEGADGDVVGPAGATDGVPALFDGTTGKAIRGGSAAQLVPSGTTLYWLQMIDGVPTFVAPSALKTSLETLTTSARLSYTAIHDLDSEAAGDLYVPALIASTAAGAGEVLVVDNAGTGIEGLATTPENPTPGTATQSSGNITLDYKESSLPIAERQTTTSANITAITVANIPLYSYRSWRVTFGGNHTITFPATWYVSTVAPSGVYTGSNGEVVQFVLFRAASTVYHVGIGNPMAVVP